MANVSRSAVDAIVYRKLNGFATFVDKDEYQLIEATKNFVPVPDSAVVRVHPTTPFSTNRNFNDSLMRNGTMRDVEVNSTLMQVVLRGNVALGDMTDRVVHYGRPVNVNCRHNPEREDVFMTSRFDWHLWGDIVRGSTTIQDRFAITQVLVEVAGDMVFNPEINGRIWPNSWDTQTATNYYPFVHPAALRRSSFAQGPPSGAQLTAERVRFFELRDVIEHLCLVLNPNETHIENPTVAELATAFSGKTDLIKNLVVPRGLTLPEALHHVLEPLGWGAYVNYINHADINLAKRRIAFVERHQGLQRFLRMQDYGDLVDYTKSNVKSVDVDLDVSDGSTNNPVVEGTPEYVETTIELVPAWDDSLDTTALDDLRMGSAAMVSNPDLSRVWRDWVANETGEYNTIRTPNNAQLDLDAVFGAGKYVDRRRRLLPMITSRPDGVPLGGHHGMQVHVTIDGEEGDARQLQQGGSWKPLRDEIGIRFDGVLPPEDMYNQGVSNLTVKVTAVIQTDEVFDKEALGTPSSLIFEAKPEHVQMRDRYIVRRVDATSRYSAQVIADTINHTEIDDSTELQALADEILEQWDHATTRGTVVLEGVDWVDTIALGTSVVGMGDRNFGFNTTGAGKATQKYPVIVAVRFRYDTQETVLLLDDRRSPVLLPLRRRR